MSETTTTQQPSGADGSSCALVDDVAQLLETSRRIAARIASGEHEALGAARSLLVVTELIAAAGLGEAATAVLLRRAHVTGGLRDHGFLSVKSFVADGAGAAISSGARVSRLGTGLEVYPRLREAVLAGRVHPDAARAAAEGIGSAVADLRGTARDEARATGEDIVLPVCELGTVADVERVAAALVFTLDPESATRRALEALERREVRVGKVGAQAVVRMVLDAFTGASLVTVLEARVDQWFRAGSLPEDLQPTGDDAEDERRLALARPRLLADAFAEIVAELLQSQNLGTKHGAPVAVTVITTADPRSGEADGEADGEAPREPGELLVPGRDSVPVPAELVDLMMCDAVVTPVHVHGLHAQRSTLGQMAASDRRVREVAAGIDPHDVGHHHDQIQPLTGVCGHVHCVGRRHRTATREQWAALLVRDRHCRFPGCRVDASRCQAHHVKEWDDDGATCLSNLILICARHHALVHLAKWRILPDPAHDPGYPDRWRFHPPETGYLGRDGALLAERLRRGLPPEPPGAPPAPHAA